MSDAIKLIQPIITGQPQSGQPVKQPVSAPVAQGPSFRELLDQQLHTEQLTFSKHAQQRTAQRGVQFSENDLARLGEAVERAQSKGLGDTLVLMDNNAFIVNAPNRVVVTVMDSSEQKGNVFTNIDGAVIV